MQLSVRAVAGQIVTAFKVTPLRIYAEHLLFAEGKNNTVAVVVLMFFVLQLINIIQHQADISEHCLLYIHMYQP